MSIFESRGLNALWEMFQSALPFILAHKMAPPQPGAPSAKTSPGADTGEKPKVSEILMWAIGRIDEKYNAYAWTELSDHHARRMVQFKEWLGSNYPIKLRNFNIMVALIREESQDKATALLEMVLGLPTFDDMLRASETAQLTNTSNGLMFEGMVKWLKGNWPGKWQKLDDWLHTLATTNGADGKSPLLKSVEFRHQAEAGMTKRHPAVARLRKRQGLK
jgi:hypothetical protein